MASSRRFEDIKDQLITLKEQIRIHIRRNANEITINKMFVDGDKLIVALESEVDKCPASVMSEMNGRLFSVRNEWSAFKKTARRPALLSDGSWRSDSSSAPGPMTRSAVLNQGIEALQSTSISLQRAEMSARESEEIGANVLEELNSQRETLLQARERVDVTNVDLKKSHRILRVLNLQLATNKCLLLVIITIEILILLGIIYLRFIRKHNK